MLRRIYPFGWCNFSGQTHNTDVPRYLGTMEKLKEITDVSHLVTASKQRMCAGFT